MPVDAGLLRDESAVIEGIIKGTPCIYYMIYITALSASQDYTASNGGVIGE